MGWLILLGRTMQDTTSYFNKTIRCQSAKEISMEYFIENVEYEDCMFLRLEVNGKNYDSPIKPGTKQLTYSIQPGILKEGTTRL